jgi:hypothetical protein
VLPHKAAGGSDAPHSSQAGPLRHRNEPPTSADASTGVAPSKLAMRVRFPPPAPRITAGQPTCEVLWSSTGGPSGRPVSGPWRPLFSAPLVMNWSRRAGPYGQVAVLIRPSRGVPVTTSGHALSSRPCRVAIRRTICATVTARRSAAARLKMTTAKTAYCHSGSATSRHRPAGRAAGRRACRRRRTGRTGCCGAPHDRGTSPPVGSAHEVPRTRAVRRRAGWRRRAP